MVNFLYEMRLQGIMLTVFVILDWTFVLMNTTTTGTTMIPCRRVSWREWAIVIRSSTNDRFHNLLLAISLYTKPLASCKNIVPGSIEILRKTEVILAGYLDQWFKLFTFPFSEKVLVVLRFFIYFNFNYWH